jgi:hypothetical protein
MPLRIEEARRSIDLTAIEMTLAFSVRGLFRHVFTKRDEAGYLNIPEMSGKAIIKRLIPNFHHPIVPEIVEDRIVTTGRLTQKTNSKMSGESHLRSHRGCPMVEETGRRTRMTIDRPSRSRFNKGEAERE